jgi:hypothetical protein
MIKAESRKGDDGGSRKVQIPERKELGLDEEIDICLKS